LKYEKIYDEYSPRKPVMLSETGVAWYNNNNPKMDVTAWGVNTLERLYGYLPLMYPRIKAVFYFNQSMPGDCSLYNLYDNDEMYQAYRQLISTPYYLENWQKSSPFCYRPLGDTPPSEVCELASNINDEEGQVAAVEYYLDGRLAGRATSIPWTVACRFPPKGGEETLEVRALDAQGNVISRTSRQVRVPAWKPVNILLDGRPASFDVAPAISYGMVLVPIRAVSEMLGAQVSWDGGSRIVLVSGGGESVSIQVDKKLVLVNGSPEQMDVGADIVDGRVMVPLRFLAELYGLQVSWDGAGTVRLNH
jgi:hypothetical protein